MLRVGMHKPSMKKLILPTLLLISVSSAIAFESIFNVPEKATLLLRDNDNWKEVSQCYDGKTDAFLDSNGRIALLVWNIYKQNKPEWKSVLDNYSADKALILLQEASLTDELRHWMVQSDIDSQMVEAFRVFDESAGVMSLSHSMPEQACAHIVTEPWLRLPKSALYTRYPLSNGESLAVINIHAVNFTIGVEEYEAQLQELYSRVKAHTGPMLLAGDFNTWNESRIAELERIVHILELKAVEFNPDERKRFVTGLPLDHIYYKNMTLINAKAPFTDASDHSPLMATFNIKKPVHQEHK